LATTAPSPESPAIADDSLATTFKTLCENAGGDIGAAVVHVESGRTTEFEARKELPLYSVYKLPLAVTVLQEVEKKTFHSRRRFE
jgi:beta-lactamase class A